MTSDYFSCNQVLHSGFRIAGESLIVVPGSSSIPWLNMGWSRKKFIHVDSGAGVNTSKRNQCSLRQIFSATSKDAFKAHESVTSVLGFGGICLFRELSPLHIPHICLYSLCWMIPTKDSLTHRFFFCNVLRFFYRKLSSCQAYFFSITILWPDQNILCLFSFLSSHVSKCYPFFTFQLESHILHKTSPNHPRLK